MRFKPRFAQFQTTVMLSVSPSFRDLLLMESMASSMLLLCSPQQQERALASVGSSEFDFKEGIACY